MCCRTFRVQLPLSVVALVVIACTKSGISPELRSQIPDRATTVKLRSDSPPEELYAQTYRFLRQKGFRFSESEEEMLSLSTEVLELGQSRSDLRVDVLIEPVEGGSLLTATAEYHFIEDQWNPVAYKGSDTKQKLGFEELFLLIRQIPHTAVWCEVDEERARRALP